MQHSAEDADYNVLHQPETSRRFSSVNMDTHEDDDDEHEHDHEHKHITKALIDDSLDFESTESVMWKKVKYW